MRGRNLLFLLLLMTPLTSGAAEPADWTFTPSADVRVRQEMLDGVYHFAPDPDRNWIRMRTRAGAKLATRRHALNLRLANEHRHFLHQDKDFDWDELIVDRLAWSWQVNAVSRLTFGRQDIIWPGGFLMLEGHPLDGSRSIYHHAVRWQASLAGGELDLALIRNPKQDDFVLSGDLERELTNEDEVGVTCRWDRGPWSVSMIWKKEELDAGIPDQETYTFSAGFFEPEGDALRLIGEIALQRRNLDFNFDSTFDWSKSEPGPFQGWALAGHFSTIHRSGPQRSIEAGVFYYSGVGEYRSAFRAPWGNWPKWSELYIYTLIGESTADRVHVAAWENIAGSRLEFRRPLIRILNRELKMRLATVFLMAPVPRWQGRGLLTQVEVKADLAAGWQAHLLWERLDPGSFHDKATGPRFFDEPVHFVRWQLSYAIL